MRFTKGGIKMLKNKYYAILVALLLAVSNLACAQVKQTDPAQEKLITQYFNEKKYDLVVEKAKEYLTANPGNVTIINLLTEAYINKTDFAAAETTVKKAIAIQSNNPWSSRLLACIYREKANVQKKPTIKSATLILAAKEAERGLASNPEDVGLLAEAARIYSAQGDKAKVNQVIDKAIRIDPKNTYLRDLKEKMNQ